MDAVEALLARLIDDAGQFPPARKPLERAVADHAAARSGPYAWMLGRFLCPASKLQPGLPQPLGVVSDGDWASDLEAAVAAGADAFELRGGETVEVLARAPLTVFVEGADDLRALAEAGVGAKLRCGGLDAAAFPSDAAVADFIAECRRLCLPFKATAGLHHPFRTRDDGIGVLQHGFVNLLAATALEVDDLESVIAEDDPEAFALAPDGCTWRGIAWDPVKARRLFTAYGSCSVTEPVEDLVAAGVIAEGARA